MKKLILTLAASVIPSGCGIIEAGSTNDAQDSRLNYLQAQINTNNGLIASLTKQINALAASGTADSTKIAELQTLVRTLQAIVASQQQQLAALTRSYHDRD